jgi:hypothetical protein
VHPLEVLEIGKESLGHAGRRAPRSQLADDLDLAHDVLAPFADVTPRHFKLRFGGPRDGHITAPLRAMLDDFGTAMLITSALDPSSSHWRQGSGGNRDARRSEVDCPLISCDAADRLS